MPVSVMPPRRSTGEQGARRAKAGGCRAGRGRYCSELRPILRVISALFAQRRSCSLQYSRFINSLFLDVFMGLNS